MRIEKDYSPLDLATNPMLFDHSAYYEPEMGPNLLRQWISMTQPLLPTELVGVKLDTNRLEGLWATAGGKRSVNLDPGYITQSKVILATTKDYDHRIYVADGIYEEVTLHFRRPAGFEPWPWTYPDYKTQTAIDFFNAAREKLRQYEREFQKQDL